MANQKVVTTFTLIAFDVEGRKVKVEGFKTSEEADRFADNHGLELFSIDREQSIRATCVLCGEPVEDDEDVCPPCWDDVAEEQEMIEYEEHRTWQLANGFTEE